MDKQQLANRKNDIRQMRERKFPYRIIAAWVEELYGCKLTRQRIYQIVASLPNGAELRKKQQVRGKLTNWSLQTCKYCKKKYLETLGTSIYCSIRCFETDRQNKIDRLSKKVRKDVAAGLTHRAISKKYNIGVSTIRRYLSKKQ